MNWEEFKQILSDLPPRHIDILKLIFEDEKIMYGYGEYSFGLSREDFMSKTNPDLVFKSDEITLSGDTYYEVLVDTKSRGYGMRAISELQDTSIVDEELKITYSVQEPTLQFMMYILNEGKERTRHMRRMMGVNSDRLRYILSREPSLSLEQLLLHFYRFPFSILIKTESRVSEEKKKAYIDGLMFNLSYNTGVVFKQIDYLDDLFPEPKRRKNRRIESVQDIEPPKRRYLKELTAQYYMGVSSSDPFIEFLCYYHVLEHFFDVVYKEDIIKSVQDEITSPKFSSRRQKDVVKLIETIQNKTKANKSEYQLNEQEALSLVLRKYIPSLEGLKNDIEDEDTELTQYYRSHQVSFSKGDEIDLTDHSNDKLYAKIAARIYKTRNSIVHSKSNDFRAKDRGIYVPFKNEVELSKEIPLMRIIAESIIIASSSMM